MNNSTINTHDYITVVKNASPCNKSFSIQNGSIHKTPASTIYDAKAQTVRIESPTDMAEYLRVVGEDPDATIILGYIKGTEHGTPYQMTTAKTVLQLRAESGQVSDERGEGEVIVNGINYYARLKANFSPSSWFVFDYDEPVGMPDGLKCADFQSWLSNLDTIVPGIRQAGYVMLPSSTSRVTIDGLPTKTANKHMLVQARDPDDVERFGRMLFLHSLQQGYGFSSTTKGGALRRQTIFDPTTFSRERLLFEGKPTVHDSRLAVLPVCVEHVPGDRLDTSLVENIVDRVEGVDVTRSSSGQWFTNDYDSLTSDTEIETKEHGTMTLDEYLDSSLDKIRVQSPFRGSESWAAYLNRHTNKDSAFLFDVGSQTKYYHSRSAEELFGSIPDKPTTIPAPPTNVAPAPAPVVPAPPIPAPPALALVGGTDIDQRYDERFEQAIREIRLSHPNTSERNNLVLQSLRAILELGPEWASRAIPWEQEVKAASELSGEQFKKLIGAAKALVKKKGRMLDEATPVHRVPVFGWPDVNHEDKPFNTIENGYHMFKRLGVESRYNTMAKELDVVIPWSSLSEHSAVNDAFTEIASISRRNGLSPDEMTRYAVRLANNKTFNPVEDWIDSTTWDGVSRLDQIVDSMDCRNKPLGRILLRRWMISAIAAIYNTRGVTSQGVLVLQGEQGVGKTTWLKKLAGEHHEFFKEGHHLDLKNKDTIILALRYWLVELGELDSMFKSKRQAEELKAFITADEDEIRLPYERAPGKWVRRTVFCATVNPDQFLTDATGNRRYWTLTVGRPDFHTLPDMAQAWAEAKTWYDAGESWSLSKGESHVLEISNNDFREAAPAEEILLERYDWDSEQRGKWTPATTVFGMLFPGAKPTSAELKQVRESLEVVSGEKGHKTNKGLSWRLPPMRYEGAGELLLDQ